MEYRLSEIATNVGNSWNRMSETGEIDLLYATSIGFLVVITIAIVAALFSYNRSKSSGLFEGLRSYTID